MRAKSIRRVVALLAATAAVVSLVVAPTSRATPADGSAVAERSQVYERVEARASCGASDGVRAADGDMSDWVAAPGGVTGAGHYAGGEYLWVDYTYDDAGTGRLQYPGEGDVLVRDDGEPVGHITDLLNRYGGSAADVVEGRFAADDEYLHLAVVLNFLNALDTTVVTFGIDVDGDQSTGVHDWPFGAGLSTPGADVFLTAHPSEGGFCATVDTPSTRRAVDQIGGAAAIDTVTNAIEITVPRSLIGAASSVEVVAGSGLWDGPTGAWKRPISGAHSRAVPEEIRPGEPTDVRGGASDDDPGVFNLLFRTDEPMIDPGNATDAAQPSSGRAFEYARQAEVLAGGTSGSYALDLDLSRIVPGAAADPAPTRRGDQVEFTRQYVSDVDLEGLLWVENDLGSDVLYLGRRQSYAVHLPPCLAGDTLACPPAGVPLSVSFHGGSGSHINQLEAEGAGIASRTAERAQVLTIAPFGRGRRAPWWRGLGEVDVLEAMADAEAAYGVDPDRRLPNGHSLGGYATLRFASLYPDLWAGAAPMCAAAYENSTSTREPGNEAPETQAFTVLPLLGSLVNTPVVQVNGTIDPLVRIDSGRRVRDRLLAEGVDLRYTEWVNGHHCTFVPETQQRFLDWHVPEMLRMVAEGRESDPAVVRYAVDPRQFTPGVEWMGIADIRDVGVAHDRAWWLSDVTVRDEIVAAAASTPPAEVAGNTVGGPGDDLVGTVTAVSHMLDGWQRSTESCGDEVGIAGVSGNPDVEREPGSLTGQTYPDPHFYVCQSQVRATPAVEPVLELAVRNLDGLRVDTGAAGLGGGFVIHAVGDGPVTVSLSDVADGQATGDCVAATRQVDTGLEVRLELSAERCEVSVEGSGSHMASKERREGSRGPRSRVVDGRVEDWSGDSSGIAGSDQYDAGEFIHQDYVYDDAGADVQGQRPPQRGTFEGRTTGTYRYPADPDRYADNAADLLELRLATGPDVVHGLVRLNTLRATDTTIASIAVDTDGDLADTDGTWPRDAGISTPGADVVITVWGTGGEITDLATGASTPIEVAADADDDHNALEFAVDRSFLPGDTWRVWAATGLWDGVGWMEVPGGAPTETTPGHGDPALPRAFNVAFRGRETGGLYEDRQAAALATGDITVFSAMVDVAALDAREHLPAQLPVGEFVEVVVDQELTIGPLHEGTSYEGGVAGRNEGIAGALNQSYEFFGRHQPYTLRLPADWSEDSPSPALFALHGLGGTHAGWVTYDSFVEQVLEADGQDSLVLVAPLARGSSFYADYGELDALAQLADAEARVSIDPDRRYLVGYSMGGYGMYRFATTRPDLWAAAATFAGYTGEFTGNYAPRYGDVVEGDPAGLEGTFTEHTGLGGGRAGQAATGNPVALLGNVREIPILHAAGTNDQIVPTSGQYRAAQTLDALDHRHRFDLYPGYEHLSFALLDDWAGVRDWFGDQVRTRQPRQVTYAFSPTWADPALDLGIRHDRAYWVSDLERRTGDDDPELDTHTYGRIDAVSHAVAADAVIVEPVREPAMGNHPHLRIGDRWAVGDALPVDNRLTLELTNVSAASVDVDAAGLSPDGLVVELATDGPVTLTLVGTFAGRHVSVSDGDVVAEIRPGSLRIVLDAAGTATVTISTRP